MTERDPLAEAFAALRDETAASTKDAGGGRAVATRRALLIAASKAGRRATIVRLVLPLAAVLAATAAWAAASGRLDRLLGAEAQDIVEGAPSVPPARSVPPPLVNADEDAGLDDAALEPADESDSATPLRVERARPPRSGASSAAPPPAASVERPEIDPEEAPYQTAHEAHFVARDWPRALVAWDAYLAAYPNGRLAPEARYNRALVLLRLGRSDDARAALRPFAEGGRFEGYRQREATQLIDAIDRGAIKK